MEIIFVMELMALSIAAHASLQRPFSNQILTPKQSFDFAEGNLCDIISFFLSSEEVVSNTDFLELRFATSSTFKRTRDHHQFIPNALLITRILVSRIFRNKFH